MGAAPEIVIEASADELAQVTAGRVVDTLVAALAARPDAHLVVTGGGILEQLMTALRDRPDRDSVDWPRVHVWWGDERYVPADSDDRNDKAAFAALFAALPLDPARVHRMPASDAGFGDDVEAAAASYAAELAGAVPADRSVDSDPEVPAFDVVLLGIGPDGHCASLFPEHPGVYERAAAVIGVRNSPKPPPTRVSLTFRGLDAANEIWVVASGEGKADAVARALGGAPREQVPSAGPRGRQRTLWLLDRDAAGQLPPDPGRPTAG